jgi:hypothetical protein
LAQARACATLVNNFALSEAGWQDIIRGLSFDGRNNAWAEKKWDDVVLSYIVIPPSTDRRQLIASDCGLRERDNFGSGGPDTYVVVRDAWQV